MQSFNLAITNSTFMLCILPGSSDPYFCLATEEYLLRNFTEDIFMLWQSHDTVVVGKHQNAMAEIDYRYTREQGIKIARRISGGGTVFHDQGNVNFTFIRNVAGPHEISFSHFTRPIVEALATMGVRAETSGRNDLLVEGKKISGNAEHVFKNRVLHHGTLLYQSNLATLGNAIRVVPGKYVGKAVQSNRSIVANIADFMKEAIPIAQFIEKIMEHQLNSSPNCKMHQFSSDDHSKISKLAKEKFETWEWQFGYSPAYSFINKVQLASGTLSINAEIEKCRFTKVRIEGDHYSGFEGEALEKALVDRPHTFESIEKAHKELGIGSEKEVLYSWF